MLITDDATVNELLANTVEHLSAEKISPRNQWALKTKIKSDWILVEWEFAGKKMAQVKFLCCYIYVRYIWIPPPKIHCKLVIYMCTSAV